MYQNITAYGALKMRFIFQTAANAAQLQPPRCYWQEKILLLMVFFNCIILKVLPAHLLHRLNFYLVIYQLVESSLQNLHQHTNPLG